MEVTVDLKSNFSILRHRKLKFGIQISLDLRNKVSFWLLGGFDYHGNTRSFILSATVEQ